MTNPRNIGEEKEVWVECGEVVANADEATISAFALRSSQPLNWDGITFVI